MMSAYRWTTTLLSSCTAAVISGSAVTDGHEVDFAVAAWLPPAACLHFLDQPVLR
jgi:hypothetical protein